MGGSRAAIRDLKAENIKSSYLMKPCINNSWSLLEIYNNTMRTYAIRWIAWLDSWRRTWQAAISLGEMHAVFEPRISECDFAKHSERRRNAGNWNVLVPAGKEINWDSVSNSERKQNRANRICCSNVIEMWCCRTILMIQIVHLKFPGMERYKGW